MVARREGGAPIFVEPGGYRANIIADGGRFGFSNVCIEDGVRLELLSAIVGCCKKEKFASKRALLSSS